MKIAISGASGKTGYRVAEEVIREGYKPKLLLRKNSIVPESIKSSEKAILDFTNSKSIDDSIKGCDALIIATGARPSIDLTGPARIDACGVHRQVESCKRVGVKRVILISSLCTGRLFHPLNLFGMILLWKRIGEKALENSGLDWTVIRPGGLNEKEENLDSQAILYSKADEQQDAYIPRRLVAKACSDAIKTPISINQIIEVTSSTEYPKISMEKAIKAFKVNNN